MAYKPGYVFFRINPAFYFEKGGLMYRIKITCPGKRSDQKYYREEDY